MHTQFALHPSPLAPDAMSGYFVTGTDTGVGKTTVAVALITALAQEGYRVLGMKPVASGAEMTHEGLRSADAEALRRAGNVPAGYGDVNPYLFAPATAPHLAARAAGVEICIDTILAHYQRLVTRARQVVVEGVGGWLVPLNARETTADLARALDLPVILVVGLRLGAINHALLTVESIAAHGCRLAAWVANDVEGDVPGGYIDALRERIPAPCLGVIAHGMTDREAAKALNLRRLGL